MPRSYFVPDTYFDGITDKIPPNQRTQPTMVPQCDHRVIQPAALEAYQFETERYIASSGLNIYDGACWSLALALLGEDTEAISYTQAYIQKSETCQLGNIRGNATCMGVILDNQCADNDQIGACGFCYGSGSDRSLDGTSAWLFRTISDSWAYQNTVDERCPELGLNWIWNDYKPVLGENAWSNILAPLQIARIRYGSARNIPDNDYSLTLAINFVKTLPRMKVPGVGGFFYSPKNTLENNSSDFGFTFSVENNISLLASLKTLLAILLQKNTLPDIVSLLRDLITNGENLARNSYDPSLGYFRQGGRVVNGNPVWTTGGGSFAVDCQTWYMTVIGPKKIDQWFGAGTARKVWSTTKRLGGYRYRAADDSCDGLGYSINSDDQAYSGEWTLGGINMLRVFASELNDQKFLDESNSLRKMIESKLTRKWDMGNGKSALSVMYANKRYFIPFGWFSNPVPSTASTAWSVFADTNFNPFFLGGNYSVYNF